MSEQNKALVRRFYDEVLNAGKLDRIDEFVTPDFVDHEDFPGSSPGRDGAKEFFAMLRTAFPDLRFSIEDVLAEGDRVVVRLTLQGTHQGPFLDMPPTGKPFNVQGIDILRLADGQLAEHWGVTDQMSMLQQLGAIPD